VHVRNPFDGFRLYASAGDLGKLRIIAGLAGGLSVGFAFALVPEIAFTCGAIAATLLIVAALITAPDQECSFCRRPRVAVKLMVAGQSTSVCDECAAQSLGVVASEHAQKKDDIAWLTHAILALPNRCPRAISTPLFRACAIKDQSHREALLRKAFDIGNPGAVEELIRRSPEESRSGTDWVNLGVALELQGRFREAIEAVEHVAGMPDQEPWLLNNRGSALVELENDAPTLRRLLADNVRARQLLEALKPPGAESVGAAMLGAGAELHRRLGERDAALECLRSARAIGGEHPTRLITHAKLEGNSDQGRQLLEQALELAHPESREAEEARRLLETFMK
jgi:tetratricopeptide (TPR) repeat protein